MNRFLAGFIVGSVLIFSVQGLAAMAGIGSQVTGTMPLIIDGIRAAKDVIIIEGTSYLPVRVTGEMFGYEVSYNDELRQVELSKQGTEVNDDMKIENVPSASVEENGILPLISTIPDLNLAYPGSGTYYAVIDGELYFDPRYFTKYIGWEKPYYILNFPNEETHKVMHVMHNSYTLLPANELPFRVTLTPDAILIEP